MWTETRATAIGSIRRVALIGYGEVGRILAEDLRARDVAVTAYDLKLGDPEAATPLRQHAAKHAVLLVDTAAAAAAGASLTVSAVTASQTESAAEDASAGLRPGDFFLDLNSASPAAKTRAARIVAAVDGRYVEGAVMTSVPPYRLRVPLLLGGPDAADLAEPLAALGFEARVVSKQVGVASATKMCRSVMIKGLEAMVVESFTAARHYGVENAVIASLKETFPGVDWEQQATYFFQRAIEHGRRRAEEMREAAETMREAGLEPWSAAGTAERQAWIADLSESGVFGAGDAARFARSDDWRIEADRVLALATRQQPFSGDKP
jgi:3-hydroxyisobutyrate dehydrogenase-like beta-hydroxyacid dehydrogenase